MAVHEVFRQCGKPIIVAFRPTVFDRDVSALDVARFLQTLVERGQEMCIRSERSAVEIADHRQRRLLRVRSHRPRYRCAAKRDYEFPSPDMDYHATHPRGSCLCNKGTLPRFSRAVCDYFPLGRAAHKGSPQVGIGPQGKAFCRRSNEWEPEMLFAETSIDDLGDIFRLGICTTFKPGPHLEPTVTGMLDQVIAWGGALKPLRAAKSDLPQ